MAIKRNIWFRMGQALGRAQGRLEVRVGQLRKGLTAGRREPEKGRAKQLVRREAAAPPAESEASERALTPWMEKALLAGAVAGGGALIAAVLRSAPSRSPGPLSLVRAGAAGAGAAVARMAVRHLVGLEEPETETSDPLAPVLAGAARGLVFASVVEPRIPGPPVLRGATYGALEFAARPWGGVEGLLDTLPVHRRVPFLAALLDARDDDPSLAGHVLFGVVLASLYGRGSPV